MGFGLFGKLPQKRDFISHGIANDILSPLETWLQTALAASRSELGHRWQEAYLVAPIWRLWIGADILGVNCVGSLMPSVDGIGRFFPLLALYACEPGERLPPPAYAPQDKWFGLVEERLLGVLEEGATPTVDAILAGLAAPALDTATGDRRGQAFKGGVLWRGDAETDTASLLAATFDDDFRQVVQSRSYWWAPALDTRPALMHAKTGLPDPYFHTFMIRSTA